MARTLHGLMTRVGIAALSAALCFGAPGAIQAQPASSVVGDEVYDPGRIRLTVSWADPAIIGRFSGDGLTTVVQFYNASGGWDDVSGWIKPLVNTNTVLWAVWQRDWGRGPFRWVVKNAAKGYVMGTSTGFYLPTTGSFVDVSIVIPANVAPPAPSTATLPAALLVNGVRITDPSAVATVTAASVDVRREPAVASRVFAELRRGVSAKVLRVSGDGQWAQVMVDGVEGWIQTSAGVSLSPSVRVATGNDPAAQAIVTAFAVDIRYAPSATSFAFAEFRRGVVAQVLAVSADRQWAQLSASGITGWVAANSGLTLTPAVARLRAKSDFPIAEVTVRRLTVRVLPETTSGVAGAVNLGDQVEVMAVSADGAWFNIRFGAVSGWIYAESTLSY